MSLNFNAYDRNFTVVLRRSDAMFSKDFRINIITEHGPIEVKEDLFVHYRGFVAGKPLSSLQYFDFRI